ncbi:MAG: CNNM domain-containing protein [Chromatiales bacterium]|jgi:CBS domain containing-hemolysin-like protein
MTDSILSLQVLTWFGILLCILQAGTLSGLNLAVFSLSRLNLEVEDAEGNPYASKVLEMRRESNRTLATILWANVSVNVLLTLLSDSVLTGINAFLFSTFIITMFGEIIPQAWFSRRALRVAAFFAPMIQFYRFLLTPVVIPSAWILDQWLGKEMVRYLPEAQMKETIRQHMDADDTELERLESVGALNFFTLDDLPAEAEGVPLDPESIVSIPFRQDIPLFPETRLSLDDPLLQRLGKSGQRWVVITDTHDQPRKVLDMSSLLHEIVRTQQSTDPHRFCHTPVIVRNRKKLLGEVISKLRFQKNGEEDIIHPDVILLWDEDPRIVTGSDILGRLLQGALPGRAR